jgi:3-hydroxyisobutyrate dehydrogenase
MTNSVFRCSNRVGDGQALKLVNNAIGAGYRMATLELVALGRKMGLSLSSLVKTLNEGQGANFTTRHMLVGLLEGRSTTNFALALMIKDLDAALSLGAETTSPMPMTSGARDLMQIGLNLFGHNAVLDDVIPLIEKLSDIKFKFDSRSTHALPVGVDETELLSLIDHAVMACNAVTVVECVEMGHRFGLPMSQMARILNVGSAWSRVSETILPASVSQSAPQLGCTIENVKTVLTTLSGHASQIGVPLTLPKALLNTLHSAIRKPEEMAIDFGKVCQFKFPL